MGESRTLIKRSLVLLAAIWVAGTVAAGSGADAAALESGGDGPPVAVTLPWLDQDGILNMAHQGGEFEAPSSTMYAFRTALEDRGADSLEMDVNATADDRLAVMHDYYTSKITPLDAQVRDLTLAQLQALDAAWWFSPGTGQFNHSKPADQYPLRGVRTGDKAPPDGFSADDFQVPTIDQVLAAFPDVPINIEIKSVPGEPDESIRVATLLAAVLNRPENAERRIIVASLDQNALVRFHELAPQVDLSASLTSMIGFIGSGEEIDPVPVAMQVPMVLGEMDVPAILQEKKVNDLGYAVHAWTDGEATENDASYAHLIESGVQGIMSSSPSKLADYLCRAGIRRPDSSPRCEGQLMDYRLRFPSRSLKPLFRKGFPVIARCDQECFGIIRLRIRRSDAKKFGIKPGPGQQLPELVPVGWGSRTGTVGSPKPGDNRSNAWFFGRYWKNLSEAKRLAVQFTVTVYDSHLWKRSVDRKWLVLKSQNQSR